MAIALFAWMFGKGRPAARVSLTRIVLPLLLTLTPLAVCFVYVATAILRIGLAVTHIHPEGEWQH
ncbi:MAG: hypothetical protein WBX38_04355 [Candidatus Sulfotelmatobacter sp.]